VDVTVSLSGVRYGASIDKTEVTFAGTAGIFGTLASVISYDLGYRFLQADGFDVTSNTYSDFRPTIKFPKTSAHILAAGLTIKF
jgi:opacity protein-like surface antigen